MYLYTHAIPRIHHERNANKRALIQEFPLQFATLQRSLVNLIAELGEKTQYCDTAIPQGIYFTSAEQFGWTFYLFFDYILHYLKHLSAIKSLMKQVQRHHHGRISLMDC